MDWSALKENQILELTHVLPESPEARDDVIYHVMVKKIQDDYVYFWFPELPAKPVLSYHCDSSNFFDTKILDMDHVQFNLLYNK